MVPSESLKCFILTVYRVNWKKPESVIMDVSDDYQIGIKKIAPGNFRVRFVKREQIRPCEWINSCCSADL